MLHSGNRTSGSPGAVVLEARICTLRKDRPSRADIWWSSSFTNALRLRFRFRRDAAAEFWDSHDTTHYSDVFHTVNVVGDLKRRHYEIEIDADLATTQSQARRKGLSVIR